MIMTVPPPSVNALQSGREVETPGGKARHGGGQRQKLVPVDQLNLLLDDVVPSDDNRAILAVVVARSKTRVQRLGLVFLSGEMLGFVVLNLSTLFMFPLSPSVIYVDLCGS
jgi:hypothetical protein